MTNSLDLTQFFSEWSESELSDPLHPHRPYVSVPHRRYQRSTGRAIPPGWLSGGALFTLSGKLTRRRCRIFTW